MKSLKHLVLYAGLGAEIFFCSCIAVNEEPRPILIAAYASNPIIIDGEISPAEWEHASVYSLHETDSISRNWPEKKKKHIQETFLEPGEIRLLYDNDYLYIAGTFTDSDVVQRMQCDQSHFYLGGDVLELFIKPAGTTSYSEIYFTPNNLKSSFFFFSPQYPGSDNSKYLMKGIRLKSRVRGTLNDWNDRDQGWEIEAAVPLRELENIHRTKFGPAHEWHLILVRYNYGAFPRRQRTSAPKLPSADYHDSTAYAVLKLLLSNSK